MDVTGHLSKEGFIITGCEKERQQQQLICSKLFLFVVKRGQPTNDELEKLGTDIAGGWKILGRRLAFTCATIEEIDHNYPNLPEKGFQMLLRWTQRKGSAATYQALCDALQHELVKRQDLAEKFCYANGNFFYNILIVYSVLSGLNSG